MTSSLLWQSPIPALFALSMVKASQRNLVQSLAAEYPDIHTALLNVGGPVSKFPLHYLSLSINSGIHSLDKEGKGWNSKPGLT